MSIAIKTSDNTLIYFDATTQYNISYSNSVTKYPIDGGGNVTDHIVDENPVVSVSGIISDVDFGLQRPNETFKNDGGYVSSVGVRSISDRPSIFDLPNILSKSLSDKGPSIIFDQSNPEFTLKEIKSLLVSLRDSSLNKDTGKSLFTIVEYDEGVVTESIPDCAFTSLEFSEEAEMGTCLQISFTAEQLKFVTIEKTAIPKSVEDRFKDKAAPKDKKGNQTAPPTETNPATGPKSRKLKKLLGEDV